MEILSFVTFKEKTLATENADFHHANKALKNHSLYPDNICLLFSSFCSPYNRRGLEALGASIFIWIKTMFLKLISQLCLPAEFQFLLQNSVRAHNADSSMMKLGRRLCSRDTPNSPQLLKNLHSLGVSQI